MERSVSQSASRSRSQLSLESMSDEDSGEAISHDSQGPGSSSRAESGSLSAQTTPARSAAALADRFDFAFRCCFLGDSQSWKRQLAHSLTYAKYSKQAALQDALLDQLCGVNWSLMNMTCCNMVSRIQVFDNTGSAIYSRGAFQGIDIVFVVYDLGERSSYQVALNWLQVLSFYQYDGTALLVANRWEKSLADRRIVSEAEAKLAARKYGALYAETSTMPEMQHTSLTAMEIGVRFAMFALTKRESFVVQDVSGVIDVGHVSGATKAKLLAALVAEESGSFEDSMQSKKAVPGLFGRAVKRPALLAAIEGHDVTKVASCLMASSVAVRARDPGTKATPLMVCASLCESSTDVEIAGLLIKQCSAEDINMQNGSGETPLMLALKSAPSKESTALVCMLVQANGTNVALANASGSNAFHLACEKGHVGLVQEHATLPESAFAANNAGETPLYIAARQGNATLVSAFVKDARVASRLACTVLQYTALHVAVLNSHVACVKLLLECPHLRATVNMLNKEQYTPLYLAMEIDNDETKQLLLNYGGDPRIGRIHRLMPQLVRTTFVPSHLAWCKMQDNLTMVNLSRCQLAAVPIALFQLKASLQKLDLSSNSLEIVPRQILELVELQELLLNDNLLRGGVTLDLVALTKLRVLRLDGNAKLSADLGPLLLCKIANSASVDLSSLNLDHLSMEMVLACSQLEQMALNDNSFKTESMAQLTSLRSLKSLWMHNNQVDEMPGAAWDELELLKLSGNKIRVLPHGPVGSKKLRELWVEKNLLTVLHLSSIAPTLRRLWLDGNQIASIVSDGGTEPLQLDCLSLKNNVMRDIPHVFLPSLTRLWLDGNLITHLPASFASMVNLVTLSLSENPLRVFPVQIFYLKQLVELALNDCLLEQVDPSIGHLMALRKLSLRNNRLQVLPHTIGHMTGLTLLDLTGNVDLTSPPPDTVKRGTAAVVGFLHDLIADSKPSYRMKLMVVGQEAVGKTSLLRAVTAKSKKKSAVFGAKRTVRNLSTDGIDIEQWDRKVKLLSGETVKVNFRAWDFAGQEVYYSTHSFFLSNRAVYMVVWSLTASEENQRVVFWLQSIQSRAPKAPVMLIGTHTDMPGVNCSEEYGRHIVEKYRARFPDLNIVGFTPFSATGNSFMKGLMDNLDATTISQSFIGEPLPTLYLTLEAAVAAERKRMPPVMSWDEFQKLGTSCGVLREDELLRAVALLHEMGSLFFYRPADKSTVAKNTMVVLDPQWLTKVMAQVISTKKSFVKNAILEHKDIGFMWKAPEYPVHLHGPLLSLLQFFDVCYRMDGGSDPHAGRSLIPVLLPFRNGDEMLRSSRFVDYAVQVGRVFDFEFLPAGFFGRLTVRMLHLAKQDELWADHIVVTLKDAKARVSLAGMTVSLLVQSESYDENLLMLLKTSVQSLESLAEEWFQIRASTRVPCVHCIKQNSSKPPHMFDLQECEQAAADGLSYVSCGQFPVALGALCPDVIVSSELPVIKWDTLENQVRIGEGTFACVFSAGLNGKTVAIKRLINETDFRELRKEAASLMSLKHRNVVELLGVCYKPPALVTEYMENGSLFEYLADVDKAPQIPWSRRLQFAADIAEGMLFLHTTTPPVLHRDLKSANVLLGADLVCKISDFGTVAIVAPFTTGRAVTNPRWQAPEVLLNLPYGAPSDVYAFGILLWELCTREVPFTDKASYAWAHNVEDDVVRGHRPPVRQRFPPFFAAQMVDCWAQEPDQRPSFAKIVKLLKQESISADSLDASMDIRHAQLSQPFF